MSPEVPTLTEASRKKLGKIIKDTQYALGMVMVKSWLMTIAGTIVVLTMSAALGLLQTAFPTIAGIVTVLVIQSRYVNPRLRQAKEKYDVQVKEVLEEQRRAEAQEG